MAEAWTRIENEFIETNDGVKTDSEIAAHLVDENGRQLRTPKAVENQRLRLRATKRAAQLHAEGKVVPVVIPSSPLHVYEDHMVHDGDSALIMGDLHAPAHDAAFIARACNMALDWGIDTCILGGDTINADAFAFSHVPEPDIPFSFELSTAKSVLSPILAAFKTVYMFMGNHEQRFFKGVLKQLGAEHLKALLGGGDNLHVSDYEWMILTNKGHSYPLVIIHPPTYSKLPGSTALKYANGSWTEHHVVTFHEHARTTTRSDDGRRQVFAAGMMADAKRLHYSQKKQRPAPRMQQGCVLWKNGSGHLLTPETDALAFAKMFAPDTQNLRTA